MQSHNVEIFKFSEAQFPPDFVNLSKTIPSVRISGEEEFYLKSSALPQYEPFTPTSIYSLPLKLPTHHFIYKNPSTGDIQILADALTTNRGSAWSDFTSVTDVAGFAADPTGFTPGSGGAEGGGDSIIRLLLLSIFVGIVFK